MFLYDFDVGYGSETVVINELLAFNVHGFNASVGQPDNDLADLGVHINYVNDGDDGGIESDNSNGQQNFFKHKKPRKKEAPLKAS